MDANEKQFFIELLTRCKVRLQREPNKTFIEELEQVIRQLRG